MVMGCEKVWAQRALHHLCLILEAFVLHHAQVKVVATFRK
jgi:hypothetical protein